MKSRYIIGIDLGTTNCAVAYADSREGDQAQIRFLEIPQVTRPGQIEDRSLLPSYSFRIAPGEFPEGSFELPWNSSPQAVVGAFARARGAQMPDRVVASSKSWLSHSGVDRTAPLLPWGDSETEGRISPLDASARLLEYLRLAWNHLMASENADLSLESQEVFVTVPASFDATARELTVQAAERAGISRITLLEEPQAAFYAWIEHPSRRWQDEVQVGDVILVCDIGGGTTDFSLISVLEQNGELALERIAVGDHILLGGDNMDLTLAYAVRNRLAAEGTRLDGWQMRGLLHSVRQAKEALFFDEHLPSHPITILGKGRGIVAGTISTDLSQEEMRQVIVEGFFPRCEASARPEEQSRAGLKEIGLPYASDPGITKHMAWFLTRHSHRGDHPGGPVHPTAVLFNGGVMKADALQKRTVDILNGWATDTDSVKVLASRSLDLAVAYGAVTYGLARRGRGIRIRSGTERSYYIGIESAMPAVPGLAPPVKALCVVPFGMEEGSRAELTDRQFGLIVGRPVSFRFFGAVDRHDDRIGDLIEEWEDAGLEELPPVETQLDATHTPEAAADGAALRVKLHIKVTEIGTLELWFVSDEGRWKLEFNVRNP